MTFIKCNAGASKFWQPTVGVVHAASLRASTKVLCLILDCKWAVQDVKRRYWSRQCICNSSCLTERS